MGVRRRQVRQLDALRAVPGNDWLEQAGAGQVPDSQPSLEPADRTPGLGECLSLASAPRLTGEGRWRVYGLRAGAAGTEHQGDGHMKLFDRSVPSGSDYRATNGLAGFVVHPPNLQLAEVEWNRRRSGFGIRSCRQSCLSWANLKAI